MPVYEYKCPDCRNVFEEIRRVEQRDDKALCPACHSTRAEHITSIVNLGSADSADPCGGKLNHV